jgi:alkaline phosphatase
LKHLVFLLFAGLLSVNVFAQSFTVTKGHAHNDYVHTTPFFEAYNLGFGSIEADVFLLNNELYVAHDSTEINKERTLNALYITPILKEIAKNGGKIKQPLQLLIDLKTTGNTMQVLEKQLLIHKRIFENSNISFVISGEMPAPRHFSKYDKLLQFDGRVNTHYNKQQLKRVAMFSHNFSDIEKWKGQVPLASNKMDEIAVIIKKVHQKKKKLRFWATPDTKLGWNTLINLTVDYIGTDNLSALAHYLKHHNQKNTLE